MAFRLTPALAGVLVPTIAVALTLGPLSAQPTTAEDTTEHVSPRIASPPNSLSEDPVAFLNARFQQLQQDLVEDRHRSVDRWLVVVALFLTFFGLFLGIVGLAGYWKFTQLEQEARGHLQRIKRHRRRARKHTRRLTAQEFRDHPADSLQAAERLKADPDASSQDKAAARAVELQQLGRTEEAIELWQAIGTITQDSDAGQAARAWFSVGFLLDTLNEDEKKKESVEAYSRAIHLRPKWPDAYCNRGAMRYFLGDYEEAAKDLKEALKLDAEHAQARENLDLVEEKLNDDRRT